MKKSLQLFLAVLFLVPAISWGQLYWRIDGTSATWTDANWSATGSAPFTTAWVLGSDVVFQVNSTITFATTTVGNVTVNDGITVTVAKVGTLSFTSGTVKTWTIGTGSTLTWQSQTVTTNSGAGITKNGSGILDIGAMTSTTMTGGFTLNSGTVVVTGAKSFGTAALTINGGTIQSSGGITFAPTSLTIGGDFTFTGTGNDIYGAAVTLGAVTRTITNSTATGGSRQFSGIISGNNGVGLTISGTGAGTVILSGANTYTGLTTVSGSTLQLNNAAGTTLPATNSVTVNGGTLRISKDQTISDFTMNTGTLTVDASTTLTITGAYNVTGGTINNLGTIKLNGGAVSFPGSGVTVNNGTAGTMTNLEIASSANITLTAGITVSGTLTLTGGNITTTNSNLLTLGSSATVSGGSASSFVDGPMANTWSTSTATKTFPLGKGTSYRPLDITLTTPASPVLRVEVFNSNAGGAKGTMNAISTVRYYQTSLVSGTAASGGTVKITFGADDGVTDNTTLVVGQSATAAGTYTSLGKSTSDASSITSLSYNPVSGDFLLLGDTGSNPLPVELTSFTRSIVGKKVILNWQTATEVNNYGFEVQRLAVSNQLLANSQELNANGWSKIGFVQGNGNSNSPKNYSFTDEPLGGKEFKYRLKQIDFDGTFEYSDEVTAVFDDVSKFSLEQNYPNPFNPVTKISYTIPQRSNVKLRVYNMLAQLEAELVNESQEAGHYQVVFNGSNLPSGTYFYKLEAGKFVEVKKFLLVK
jgi:autotransporter-associated beta strand protein